MRNLLMLPGNEKHTSVTDGNWHILGQSIAWNVQVKHGGVFSVYWVGAQYKGV